MADSIDSRAKHREHIQKRTEFVRGKRGPVSFVWGNHVVKPRQRVPGAPGLWSPLPEGEAGLLVEAKVMFDIDGVEQTLCATRREDNYVLHFTDATSGHMSYGSGRNVRIPADQSGDGSIDFNYATLLPCSFSRAWNCPIPPMENRLRVPIEAGERFAVDHDGVPML
ncbi:MAG: DUF1684 domain-containing protein [Burkholderiales bacterium]